MNKIWQFIDEGLVKIAGIFLVWPCIPFRKWSRSVVYNYVLQNDCRGKLSRLWQRDPVGPLVSGQGAFFFDENGYGWRLKETVHEWGGGFVFNLYAPTWKFYIAFVLWMFLDDDSVNDTTDLNHCKEVINGKHPFSVGRIPFIKKSLEKAINEEGVHKELGNAFDKGDLLYPYFRWAPTLVWNMRNLGKNYQYYKYNY